MRAICLAAMLWAGCKAEESITLDRRDFAQAVADDPASPIDLAWTDLAGGIDIAHAPDLREPAPADMAQPSADLSCGYSIGSPCTLNAQCACTKRNTCDYTGLYTGGSYQHCCVYMGDACSTSADCCQRPGVGTGVCSSGKCQ